MVSPIITLTTDFGLTDGYVASMKAVILSIDPTARIVDLCHEIRPQDIAHGAFVLATAYKYFPQGTIHVAVIDPGVGSNRRAILVKTPDFYFLGPDNGIFSYIFKEETIESVIVVDNPKFMLERISNTFHGRDIFAPVAAHLASGTVPKKFGTEETNPVKLPIPSPKYNQNMIVGNVLCIDRFGNIITNIRKDFWETTVSNRRFMIYCGKRIEQINRSYAESHEGDILAIFNSSDYLEISKNRGNAAEELDMDSGSELEIDIR